MLKFKVYSEGISRNEKLNKVFKNNNIMNNICFTDNNTLVGDLKCENISEGLNHLHRMIQDLSIIAKVYNHKVWLENKDNKVIAHFSNEYH